MIAFNLITGFLGSGKTTLLKNLLSELSTTKRIAVIQNEFAHTGIDGKELMNVNQSFKLVEINNGSVFCVCQLGNFINNLLQLVKEYNPEVVFLEASGLADPISICELLQESELNGLITLNKCICLIDAPNFFKGLNTLNRVKHQIMVADHIIINKTDLVNGPIDEIVSEIKTLNCFASIQSTTYAKISWRQIDASSVVCKPAASRFVGEKSEGPPEMNACVFRTHRKISEVKLKEFLLEVQEKSLRIKGFMNLDDGRILSIHSVYNLLEVSEQMGYNGASELIVFGYGLRINKLSGIFKKYSA